MEISQAAGYDKRWYVLVTVGIGTFLSTLNTSIINTILPVIQRDIHVTLAQSEWIVLIYLLVLTLFLLPIGRLSDVWGHRRIFLSGFAMFSLSAILCGFARSYVALVLGRALLALAGSMILAVGPALLTSNFPPEQRGRVLGIQAIMTYIGLSLGPILGGWLTELWGWPVTFFVVAPFGLVGLGLGLWAVPRIVRPRPKRLDLTGFVLFIVGMTAATLLLNSNVIRSHRLLISLLLLFCFAVCTWAFLRVEQQHPDPMLDLKLFRLRNFGFGTLGAALNYLCFFVTLFLLPFYFDHILHISSAVTGSYLSIAPVVMTVCAPIAGALSDKTGPRLLTSSGMLFSALSLILFGFMAKLPPGADAHILLIVGLILAGLGTGTFAAPNNSAILGAASREKQGAASGTLATVRYVGMMAGITLGGSLFDFLLGAFAGHGPEASFVAAFAVVMWVGAGFGFVGIGCTLAMENRGRRA